MIQSDIDLCIVQSRNCAVVGIGGSDHFGNLQIVDVAIWNAHDDVREGHFVFIGLQMRRPHDNLARTKRREIGPCRPTPDAAASAVKPPRPGAVAPLQRRSLPTLRYSAAICAAFISLSARRYSTGITLRNFGHQIFQSLRIFAAMSEPVNRAWRAIR